MSNPAERIDKFHVDISRWTNTNTKNDTKLIGEVVKLSSWLMKHQNETVADSGKEILLSIIESLYKYVPRDPATPQLKDTILNAISDFLKLPEGKLVSSKSKKKVLKWYEAIASRDILEDVKDSIPIRWIVADISSNMKLSLMKADVESEEVLDDIEVHDEVLLGKLISAFDVGNVYVEMDHKGAVVAAYFDDGTLL